MTDTLDKSQYVLPNDTGIVLLDCEKAFQNLSNKEKLYSHYLSQASWYGGLIVLVQTSPESPEIFILLQKVFRSQSASQLKVVALEKGVTEEEFQALLIYASAFYANMGNYKSFGDSKIIPNLRKEKFEIVVMSSAAAKEDQSSIKILWDSVSDKMYGLSDKEKELGLGDKGTSAYFSGNCDSSDAEIAQEFLQAKDISPYNTRLFKTTENGKTCYEIRLASAVTDDTGSIKGLGDDILGTQEFTPELTKKPCTFKVTRGDYSELMKLVVENLEKAKEYAANDDEKSMLTDYMESFRTGSLPAHKDGSRHWIKNKGPIVETYIGFIESYRDPSGVRGEFEGFVAVVNKEMSAKFGALVSNAEKLLALLPWPAAYEKDEFLRPDFTSLDVLTFGGSGIPAGINIPNYDDIRQTEGFKNVSLGNVIISAYKDTVDKVNFLAPEDKELFVKLKTTTFEVQVGLHELLGHGSGKLFQKDKDGNLNFDQESVIHTETDKKITSWYEHTETWDTKFTSTASSYEECRAECVGLYLCLSSDALRIFGHTGDSADDIIYINWLNMVRAGLMALEFYSPETGAWRQAHMNARFVILRVLLEKAEGLVKVKRITGDDGKEDILITLDRSKILHVGKNAIGDFLRKLQVYKSTADVEAGRAMYNKYSDVNDREEPHFLSLRKIVLARKQPRKMFVQHGTFLKGTDVELRKYESDASGLIQSWVDRFPSSDIDSIMQDLADKDRPYF